MREVYFNNSNIETISAKMLQEIEHHIGRKRELNIVADKTALLILDMQDYFLDRSSKAYIPTSETIIPNINKLIKFAESINIPIFITKHINTNANAGMMAKWWSRLIDGGDELSEISSQLNLPKHYQLIVKHQYDAFYLTELDNLLKTEGISNLIISGVMTNLCVETSIRSAFVRGYNTILPIDATATYNYQYHYSSCLNLAFGFTRLCKSSELIDA